MGRDIMKDIIREIHKLDSMNLKKFYDFSSKLDESKLFFKEPVNVDFFDTVDIPELIESLHLLGDSANRDADFAKIVDKLKTMTVMNSDFV